MESERCPFPRAWYLRTRCAPGTRYVLSTGLPVLCGASSRRQDTIPASTESHILPNPTASKCRAARVSCSKLLASKSGCSPPMVPYPRGPSVLLHTTDAAIIVTCFLSTDSPSQVPRGLMYSYIIAHVLYVLYVLSGLLYLLEALSPKSCFLARVTGRFSSNNFSS